jgi:TonB family protein
MRIHAILLSICLAPAFSQQLKENRSAEIDVLIEAAGKGDAKSQCDLAKRFLERRYSSEYVSEAVKWFRRSADQGFPEAQGWIGALHDAGLGVPRDYIEAAKWYRRAAEKGDASAQLNLGFMYQQGRNLPVYGPNGEFLALPVNNGGTILPDYAQAAKWYGKAAEQGSSFAQSSLGWLLLEGKGMNKNSGEALGLFLKAAEQGDASAQCILGELYVEGKAVQQDCIQAHRWLSQCSAAIQGKKLEIATKLLNEIASQMSVPNIEEARRLAKLDAEQDTSQSLASTDGGKKIASPVILIDPMPSYTEQARKARAEGVVLSQCIVRKDGTVGRCKIMRGLGHGLDESSVNTIAARWRFKPGSCNGEPVDVKILIETSFRLY